MQILADRPPMWLCPSQADVGEIPDSNAHSCRRIEWTGVNIKWLVATSWSPRTIRNSLVARPAFSPRRCPASPGDEPGAVAARLLLSCAGRGSDRPDAVRRTLALLDRAYRTRPHPRHPDPPGGRHPSSVRGVPVQVLARHRAAVVRAKWRPSCPPALCRLLCRRCPDGRSCLAHVPEDRRAQRPCAYHSTCGGCRL